MDSSYPYDQKAYDASIEESKVYVDVLKPIWLNTNTLLAMGQLSLTTNALQLLIGVSKPFGARSLLTVIQQFTNGSTLLFLLTL